MACESWRTKIDAYVDGELSASEAMAFASHVRQCPACAADALERSQLKRSVAAWGKRYAPSAEFRAKITQSMAAKPRRSWRGWRLVVAPAALAIALLAAVTLYLTHEKTTRDRVYSELADLHVTTLASPTPVDVVSSDRHTVKPWFEGKLPFTFNLPELQGSDFTLVGGKVTYLGQTPGAHLIYQLRKHEISVFIFQERGEEAARLSSRPVSEFSFHMESFTKDKLRYFVVGDVGNDDMERLSKLLRDAA